MIIVTQKKAGFTLVEMMIVIAIMAILAAIAAPNLQTYMAQRRLNGAARQVMTDLMAARMKAVSQNNQFRVSFLDDHQYKVLDDANNNNAEDSGETSTTRDIYPDYHDVTLSMGEINYITFFDPRGTASFSPSSFEATITLSSSSGSKKCVNIRYTGRIKIDDTP